MIGDSYSLRNLPAYFADDGTTSTSASAEPEALTLDTLIEVSKKLVPVKPVEIFVCNDMLITTGRALVRRPRSKKKRILKKWLKKFGYDVKVPSSDFIKAETAKSTIYFAHSETIKKLLDEMGSVRPVDLSLCRIYGIKL